jgi:NCAIR mutase (PurE)-related protein
MKMAAKTKKHSVAKLEMLVRKVKNGVDVVIFVAGREGVIASLVLGGHG